MTATPDDRLEGGFLVDKYSRRQLVVHGAGDPLTPTDSVDGGVRVDGDGREHIVLVNPDGSPFSGGDPHKDGYEVVTSDWGADKTGVLDSTVNFNLALEAGSTFIPKGTYKINGVVNMRPERDLVAAGAGVVTLKMGVGGQIKIGDRTVDSSYAGGFVGGFKIDGQGQQFVTGGALYIGFCLKKQFSNIWVTDTAGDAVVIETAQNCTFDSCQFVNSGRSDVVLDYGAGGHVFVNCEIANPYRHAVEFRQTGLSVGGYPTFLGPSGNQFFGCIMEYGNPTSPHGLVYQGAGTANQFFGCSVCPTGRTVVAPGITVEAAANAITTTCSTTLGSPNVTVVDPSNIQPLMAARIAGFPSGSIVANVVGNVVTMFGNATATAASTRADFGAQSTPPTFDGLISPGTSGFTYGIELKGNTGVVLTGKTVFTNHIAGLRTYSNDRVIADGPIDLYNTPAQWVAHTSDDSGAVGQEYTVVRRRSNAGHDIVHPASASAKGFTLRRADQAQPHAAWYQGQLLLSDGTFDPTTTGVGFYNDPADGLHYLRAFSQVQSAMVKVTGAAGATTDARYFGRYAASGPPTGGAWRLGDWIIDQDGIVWACKTAGTPGVWTAGARPTYLALTYPANAGPLVLAGGHETAGSSMNRDHRVNLRGAIAFTGAFAAGATLATIAGAHHPASLVGAWSCLKYDAVGAMSLAPVLVDSGGLISSKVAFAAGESLFIDPISFDAPA